MSHITLKAIASINWREALTKTIFNVTKQKTKTIWR